jgi:hypothetical protein
MLFICWFIFPFRAFKKSESWENYCSSQAASQVGVINSKPIIRVGHVARIATLEMIDICLLGKPQGNISLKCLRHGFEYVLLQWILEK